MVFRYLFTALVFVSPIQAQTQETPASATSKTAALPVETFASLPFVERAEISPDGTHVAGLFGINGEQRLVIMPLAGDQASTIMMAVPDETQAGAIRWINNENIVVNLTGLLPVEAQRWYVSRLIAINRTTRKLTKLLWDLNGQDTANILWIPSDGSNEILVAAQNSIYSNFEHFWPSVYKIDVTTGRKKLVLRGRQDVLDWGADHTGNVRIGLSYNDENLTSRLLYRSSTNTVFKIADRATYGSGAVLTVPFMFLPDSDNALILRDNDQGRTSVYEVDLSTQKDVKTVYEPDAGEVVGVEMGNDGALLGVYLTGQKSGMKWFDPTLAELQGNFDKTVPNSDVKIESMSADRSKMFVRVDSAETPGNIYFFDTKVGTLRRFASVNEKIGNKKLSPVKMVQYKARDGLDIEAVMVTPKGLEPKKLPLVVMPHGGPWGHDGLDYDYWAQFLASRGYIVLQPNFRGSTGYGTEFLNKGKGQMGFAMQDDISDGVKWAVEQGLVDEKRVCIVGASYGGYAAMWGIAKDPDQYRCAISISGVAALRREVNDFGDSLRGNLYKKQWQEMTPDFNAVSPINAIERMQVPLMLIHGKRDVTVDHIQSEKMYNAMKKAGKKVEFVSLPLADHYFTRQDDRVTLLSSIERFLKEHNPPD